jgi:hypothetical protein
MNENMLEATEQCITNDVSAVRKAIDKQLTPWVVLDGLTNETLSAYKKEIKEDKDNRGTEANLEIALRGLAFAYSLAVLHLAQAGKPEIFKN